MLSKNKSIEEEHDNEGSGIAETRRDIGGAAWSVFRFFPVLSRAIPIFHVRQWHS